ncbi:hypothetical protein [Streptomyces sp. CoH27]|uniref:hypothetical protein n=1 Tax=Streptomyces sp. CoH27 TaxID=2875763 RepID=UPI001CD2CD90|nr:hypothetical protein [Streptomyces sp. CoH27]
MAEIPPMRPEGRAPALPCAARATVALPCTSTMHMKSVGECRLAALPAVDGKQYVYDGSAGTSLTVHQY